MMLNLEDFLLGPNGRFRLTEERRLDPHDLAWYFTGVVYGMVVSLLLIMFAGALA